MEIVEQTLMLLHQKLSIPADYEIYFVSSATEVWEIIAQSLTIGDSLHYYNGAFGEKWFQYTSRIHTQTQGFSFGLEDFLESVRRE